MDTRRRGVRLPSFQDHGADWWRFMVAPSCPPDTRLHIRGGWIYDNPAWWGGGFGATWLVGDHVYDIADYDTHYVNFMFTQPYWYTYWGIGLIYGLRPDSVPDPPIHVSYYYTTPREWSTAAEAEDAYMSSYSLWPWAPYQAGIPLCILILRNDGNVALPNRFMPIDMVNRGRSYIFKGRTLAPRHEL